MNVLITSLLLVTVLSSASEASGPSTPPAEENERLDDGAPTSIDATIRERIRNGQKVRITDEQGREWHGRIGALGPGHLTLVTRDRQRNDIPYRTIVRIDRPHDSLANGALIGFTSGAVFGLAAVISEEYGDCEPGAFFSCGDPPAAAYVFAPLLFGGIGAGIGVSIDALISRDPNLFRRNERSRTTLTPVLGRSARGLIVSVRW
jgi:RNA methyltransferase-like protein